MPPLIYDYIIAGAGCAGLSLLARMMKNPFFANKQILVIDQHTKTQNDRTWCFWETGPGFFEPIVHHRWQQLNFYSTGFSSAFNIAPYSYKMIRGADFYSHVLTQAAQRPNITFAYGTITQCANQNNLAYAVVNGQQYFAQYIFSSLLPPGVINSTGTSRAITLLQHFKGWVIETPTNVFNHAEATFMDFRVGQQAGATFVYVLPVAPNKALVEYTLVSPTVLPDNAYNEGLKAYISQYITTQPYTVTEEEFGLIPMTDHQFTRSDGRIIFTGTAGGQTKASSGFTFQFIQKQTAGIVKALAGGRPPLPGAALLSKRFHLYDGILLHIISTGKMPGDAIFTRLFKKMPPATILRFLDNETSLLQELGIMASMPTGIFLPVAIRKIFGV